MLTQNGVIAKQLIGEQSDIDKEYLRVRFGERLIDIDQHFPRNRSRSCATASSSTASR